MGTEWVDVEILPAGFKIPQVEVAPSQIKTYGRVYNPFLIFNKDRALILEDISIVVYEKLILEVIKVDEAVVKDYLDWEAHKRGVGLNKKELEVLIAEVMACFDGE
jgi:hypothetical protein